MKLNYDVLMPCSDDVTRPQWHKIFDEIKNDDTLIDRMTLENAVKDG
jgi:hypothetical protein